MAAIGKLRTKVMFMVNTPTSSGAGEIDVLTSGPIVYGEMVPLSGARTLESGQIILNSNYRFTCRGFAGMQPGKYKAITTGGKMYQIDSYDKVDQKDFYYVFRLSTME